MSSKLYLPTVTLCCIDNQYPNLGFDALTRSISRVQFGQVIFFTNKNFLPPKHDILNLSIVSIDSVCDLTTYSEFLIKGLLHFIQTEHVLIVQWDGFLIHPNLWQKHFLDYDYIGAPWPTKDGPLVGNGGFSLRSKRLLEALQDKSIIAKHPEDQCICIENRTYLEQTYNIQFASGKVAEQFAFELYKPNFDTFGFHAVRNLPLVLAETELFTLISKLPWQFIFTEQFCEFIQSCQKLNNPQLIVALIEKVIKLTHEMDLSVISSRRYRHIIKISTRCGLYQLSLHTLLIRTKVTGWNTDALILFIRIFFHKIFCGQQKH